MLQFLYKLFRLEYEPQLCQSCETLKLLLEQERHDKNRLMDRLLYKEEPEPRVLSTPESIGPRRLPWAAMKQRLELEDKLKAEQLREESKIEARHDIKKLEEELRVSHASEISETV